MGVSITELHQGLTCTFFLRQAEMRGGCMREGRMHDYQDDLFHSLVWDDSELEVVYK